MVSPSSASTGSTSYRSPIKIRARFRENVLYDNQMGEADDSEAATEIGGGSIVVHQAD